MDAWERKEFLPESELKWSAWLEGFFQSGTKAGGNGDPLWVRNYQELYTRDVTCAALGPVAGQCGIDIGGGAGDYSIILTLAGTSMFCRDLDSRATREGRKRNERLGLDIKFLEGDAQVLLVEDESLDFCISADFFEHITPDQKRTIIGEIYRVLKPGGVAVIKTPNLAYLRLSIALKRVAALLRGKSPRIYIAHTKDNPDSEHHGLATFRQLEELFAEFHFLDPVRIPLRLRRSRLPKALSLFLFGSWLFSEHIILRVQKSYFVPTAARLAETS